MSKQTVSTKSDFHVAKEPTHPFKPPRIQYHNFFSLNENNRFNFFNRNQEVDLTYQYPTDVISKENKLLYFNNSSMIPDIPIYSFIPNARIGYIYGPTGQLFIATVPLERSSNDPNEPNPGYYYSYGTMIDAINRALQTAWNALNTALPGLSDFPSKMFFTGGDNTGLFRILHSLTAVNNDISIFYEDFLYPIFYYFTSTYDANEGRFILRNIGTRTSSTAPYAPSVVGTGLMLRCEAQNILNLLEDVIIKTQRVPNDGELLPSNTFRDEVIDTGADPILTYVFPVFENVFVQRSRLTLSTFQPLYHNTPLYKDLSTIDIEVLWRSPNGIEPLPVIQGSSFVCKYIFSKDRVTEREE